MYSKLSKYVGVLIPLGIALISLYGSSFLGINAILLALILGVAIGNLIAIGDKYTLGIKQGSGLILELAIILMAFSINYKSLMDLGWELLVIILATVSFVIFITVFLAKKFRCPGSTGWLIGFGTAICGSSAIAALAPMVGKKKEDMALALAVVNIMGLLGMVVLPFFGQKFMVDTDLATWIGASLHSAGNVAGAGFVVNQQVGELAVAIKLGRIALLTPALIVFQWIVGKQEKKSLRSGFKLPWYLLVFIGVSVLVTVFAVPSELLSYTKSIANFFLATAMAAIGLRMNLSLVAKAGRKGLLFGVVIFALQLGFILLLLEIF